MHAPAVRNHIAIPQRTQLPVTHMVVVSVLLIQRFSHKALTQHTPVGAKWCLQVR